MTSSELLLVVAAFLTSAVLTALVRQLAVKHGVLDIPNERSSHSHATPRGGGTAIVVTATAAALVLTARGAVPGAACMALAGGGTAVAVVGFLDDRLALPSGVRLAVHLLSAAWAMYWVGGLPALRVGGHLATLGWVGDGLAVLGIVWVLNLFNFMDGIDGIAASEAMFVVVAGALLSGAGSGVITLACPVAGSCAGFLLWNWPPAKIFMGDVGSGYLGYVIAVLALVAARDDPVALWVWLILGGAFFVDATVTLVCRALRGEPLHEAHRSHAYQWLARRSRSHRKVTVGLMVLNLVWLLPCAYLVSVRPERAVALVLIALLPLAAFAVAAGAGRRESGKSNDS